MTRSTVWHKTVFCLFKTQMGTLSSGHCQRISFPLLPNFQKWMFSFLWEGSRSIKLLNNAWFPWESLSKGQHASLLSLLPHVFGINSGTEIYTRTRVVSPGYCGMHMGWQSVSFKKNRNWALTVYWPVYIYSGSKCLAMYNIPLPSKFSPPVTSASPQFQCHKPLQIVNIISVKIAPPCQWPNRQL